MKRQPQPSDFDESSPMPEVGELIDGKYRVDLVLGSGGMGKVFGATHLELGQKVAIKVLTVRDDDDRREEAHERFLREGRATAALVSDHVVRVYDVGRLDSGAPFMVMEQLRGQDLAATMQTGGRLPIELAADCVRQAADAIACAHAQGIVHRDLKPSNLFLTRRSDGAALIKVLDFGISKAVSNEREPVTANLTATRSILGTPFYMSPEQVRDAKKVDFRTDIWSLGLILHELLSGSPAFDGTTLPGVCASIVADEPADLRSKRPEIPVALAAVVLKCLQKDPAKRFETAAELALALAPWAGRSAYNSPGPFGDVTVRSSLPPMSSEAIAAAHALASAPTFSISPTATLTPPQGSTLSSSALAQSGERVIPGAAPAPIKRGFSRLWFGVGAFGLLLLAGLWARRERLPTVAETKPAALATPPLPTTPISVARTASPVPSDEFRVSFESEPPGAEVFEDAHRLGTTPLQMSIAAASVAGGPRTFTLRKAGYLPYTLVQGRSSKDARLDAKLEKMPELEPSAPKRRTREPNVAASAPPPSDIFMQR